MNTDKDEKRVKLELLSNVNCKERLSAPVPGLDDPRVVS